jgi:tetratricopeptide (TPR) repeat protein
VLRHYEHERRNWTEQDTLTVNFSESLTLERLKRHAALARSEAKASRDRRLAQVTAIDGDLPTLLLSAEPVIHVPDDPKHAASMLEQLYETGADTTISNFFEQFAAILGVDSDAFGFCYMAETNLGMAHCSRFPERIQAGIMHFEQQILGGRYQVGSLRYTIGNAHSALGDERKAKASYQEAAADMAFMADLEMAAQCLKNLGASFERLGDEGTAADFYRGALEMNPQLPEAHFALGLFHHRKSLFNEAIAHFDAVIFSECELGKNATVTGWRLNALFNVGAPQEAFRAINQLLAEAHREPWVWSWCAKQVAAFGRTSVESARAGLNFWLRYVHANPAVSRARVELLLTQFYLRREGQEIGKDYLEFQAEFDDHMVHVEPEDAALVWDRLGHWAQDEENWYEAERCFRKAYEIEGGHYGYCLGVALNCLCRYEEALPLVSAQAKDIQPDELSWFQVGLANEKLSRTAEAVEAYRKALILNPDYSLAMFNMAGTLWNSGEHDRAAIVFRTAAQQFPKHELTSKARLAFPELF